MKNKINDQEVNLSNRARVNYLSLRMNSKENTEDYVYQLGNTLILVYQILADSISVCGADVARFILKLLKYTIQAHIMCFTIKRP